MTQAYETQESDLDQHNSHASLYEQIVSALLSHDHVFFSPETSPHPPLIRQSSNSARFQFGFRTIASLSLHPALEATLHLLNSDLPSAHFLLRHAQAPPAWECMYLHGILHRIEGDLDNARAWYGNVKGSALLQEVWNSSSLKKLQRGDEEIGWNGWLNRLDRWKNHALGRGANKKEASNDPSMDWKLEERKLREISLQEIVLILEYCQHKFGTEKVEDATKVWVSEDGALKEKKQNMLVGGEGWRQF